MRLDQHTSPLSLCPKQRVSERTSLRYPTLTPSQGISLPLHSSPPMKLTSNRLSAYRLMWIFVLFDLPTHTKPQRRAAALFRRDLLRDGFIMYQYSVYMRPCSSADNARVHSTRVKEALPEEGSVMIMTITDKQFSMIEHFSSLSHASRVFSSSSSPLEMLDEPETDQAESAPNAPDKPERGYQPLPSSQPTTPYTLL